SGLCFGLIVFFELWRTIIFEDMLAGWGAVIIGALVIIVFMIIDRYVEVWARKNYGPYTAEEAAA
ncbi:MAG: tetrahydromethanopterin S-methyltransferase subunit E, partial [Methanocorpusculum sp.]|nr:tetrahydromethanopterin S-methyltransferase subunit E [Methanocorpusculum sp.]